MPYYLMTNSRMFNPGDVPKGPYGVQSYKTVAGAKRGLKSWKPCAPNSKWWIETDRGKKISLKERSKKKKRTKTRGQPSLARIIFG